MYCVVYQDHYYSDNGWGDSVRSDYEAFKSFTNLQGLKDWLKAYQNRKIIGVYELKELTYSVEAVVNVKEL